MSKGDRVLIPIYAMNTDKDIWGEDAFEFKYVFSHPSSPFRKKADNSAERYRPERWESPPEAISDNPGVWSNLMTFLGGSRACIGYQFALIEFVQSTVISFISLTSHFRMKCLLFTLIRKFEFGLAIPAGDIVWRNQLMVRRPYINGAEKDGPKLPLYVKVHVSNA